MKLEFEKNLTDSPDGIGKIRETFRIFVEITAVSKDAEKTKYADLTEEQKESDREWARASFKIVSKGLVDTLEILEERESKKIADLESSLEELSYSKEPEDKKLIAELMRTKSKHFGLMMAYVNIQGLVGVEAKKQK